MLFKISILAIASLIVSFAATSLQGLTWSNYAWYVFAQMVATVLCLYVNKDINPLTYALSINGFISFFCTAIVWARGVPPSPKAIFGAVLIIVGVWFTF